MLDLNAKAAPPPGSYRFTLNGDLKLPGKLNVRTLDNEELGFHRLADRSFEWLADDHNKYFFYLSLPRGSHLASVSLEPGTSRSEPR